MGETGNELALAQAIRLGLQPGHAGAGVSMVLALVAAFHERSKKPDA
jgi:hypothetical protein